MRSVHVSNLTNSSNNSINSTSSNQSNNRTTTTSRNKYNTRNSSTNKHNTSTKDFPGMSDRLLRFVGGLMLRNLV